MRFRWQNNTGLAVTNVSMEVKETYGSSDKMSVFPLGVQPDTFSQAALVQAVARGKDPDNIYRNVAVSKFGALHNIDFFTEVAQGNVPGVESGLKFGLNRNIDTGTVPEDIWNGGGTYTGFNATAAETLQVFSSSTLDTAAGTGARTVILFGLDTNYVPITETVTLNGTTPVVTTQTFLRMDKARVVTAGSLGYNQGEITVRQSTTTANVMMVMPALKNSTNVACSTVPAGKTRVIVLVQASLTLINGGAGSGVVGFFTRELNSTFQQRITQAISSSTGVNQKFRSGLVLPEKTDMKWSCSEVSNNNSEVSALFEYIDYDN